MPILGNQTVYGLYKPLRNAMRKLHLQDSLTVLWNYAENLAIDRPIDCSAHVHDVFRKHDRSQKQTVLGEWAIEVLVREAIINSERRLGPGEHSLSDPRIFASCVNKLKELEDGIFERISEKADVLAELNRSAHRQFIWSTNSPSQQLFLRYTKLYQSADLRPLFETHLGIRVEDFVLAGMAHLGAFQSRVAIGDPPEIFGIPSLTPAMVKTFIDMMSCPLDELTAKLGSEQEYSEDYAYAYNSLRERPLIRMLWSGQPSVACPIPVLLLWAMTQGVYYRLHDLKGFDHAFGAAFQAYVGQVLSHLPQWDTRFQLLNERSYRTGKGLCQTTDWVLIEPGSALFVECKTKRMAQKAKTTIASLDDLFHELDILAKAVVQLYKSIADYRDGRYPHLPFDASSRVYPMVVTLEDWYAMGPLLLGRLRDSVREGLAGRGLDVQLLIDSPFTICSVQDLEYLAVLSARSSIEGILGRWSQDDRYRDWAFGPYISGCFADSDAEIPSLFPGEFSALFSKPGGRTLLPWV